MNKQTSWKETSQKVLETPKFLKRGTKVLVLPTEPLHTEVKGRYGQREMYIIETKEKGFIYVSPMQIVAIARAFDGKFDDAVTVEL